MRALFIAQHALSRIACALSTDPWLLTFSALPHTAPLTRPPRRSLSPRAHARRGPPARRYVALGWYSEIVDIAMTVNLRLHESPYASVAPGVQVRILFFLSFVVYDSFVVALLSAPQLFCLCSSILCLLIYSFVCLFSLMRRYSSRRGALSRRSEWLAPSPATDPARARAAARARDRWR